MRPNRRPTRPSRPTWVQDLSTETIHAMAGHFRRTSTSEDLSEAQEWLWDRLMAELAWRNAMLAPDLRCRCDLCLDPFMGEQMSFNDWLRVVGVIGDPGQD